MNLPVASITFAFADEAPGPTDTIRLFRIRMSVLGIGAAPGFTTVPPLMRYVVSSPGAACAPATDTVAASDTTVARTFSVARITGFLLGPWLPACGASRRPTDRRAPCRRPACTRPSLQPRTDAPRRPRYHRLSPLRAFRPSCRRRAVSPG